MTTKRPAASVRCEKKQAAYRSGREAEDAVARLYVSLGYRILQHNFRGRHGEIDLIATTGSELHFIEVKARSDVRYAAPQEAVSAWKRRRLRLTALSYLFRHPHFSDLYYVFDIAEVHLHRGTIHLLRNAFPAEEESWTE